MLRIRFDNSESDNFYATLTKRVNEYFEANQKSKYASTGMKIKIVFLLSLMSLFYSLMFTLTVSYTGILALGFFFGAFSFFACLNIAHDAAHGALSGNKKLNKLSLYIMNLIGINSYIWKLKHVFSHHTFPNVMGTDSDIGESKIGRILPGAKWKWFCRFQHYYIPVLYLFYSAHWEL
jgi:linoleoyl-CoA desaturase